MDKSFQKSPCTVAVISIPDGEFIEVNQEFETIFGYRRAEILGRTAAQIGLWVSPAGPSKLFRDLEAGKTAFRAKSGDEKTCRVSCIKTDLAGKPCVVMCVQDISEQRSAEELLKVGDERFRKTSHNSDIAMALTDSAGFFHEANRAFCETLGYGREELLQLNYLDITHPEDQASCKEHYSEVIARHPPPHVHLKRYLRKNGEVVSVRASGSIFRDSQGRLLKGLFVIEEINPLGS